MGIRDSQASTEEEARKSDKVISWAALGRMRGGDDSPGCRESHFSPQQALPGPWEALLQLIQELTFCRFHGRTWKKSFFGIKESLGLQGAEIAQIQMMLLHQPCGSRPKQGTAGDQNKANVKQHRSSEQVISSPDSNAGLIFFPPQAVFPIVVSLFFKAMHG